MDLFYYSLYADVRTILVSSIQLGQGELDVDIFLGGPPSKCACPEERDAGVGAYPLRPPRPLSLLTPIAQPWARYIFVKHSNPIHPTYVESCFLSSSQLPSNTVCLFFSAAMGNRGGVH
jgi:hypothetical protein